MHTRGSDPLGTDDGALAGIGEGSMCGMVTGSSGPGKPTPIVTATVPCPPSTASTGAGRPPIVPLAIDAPTAPCKATPDEKPLPAGSQVSSSETANRPSAALSCKVSAPAETGLKTVLPSPTNPEPSSMVSGDQPPSPSQDGLAADVPRMSAGGVLGNRDSAPVTSAVEDHLDESADDDDELIPLAPSYRDVQVVTTASSAADSSDADDDCSSESGSSSESSPPRDARKPKRKLRPSPRRLLPRPSAPPTAPRANAAAMPSWIASRGLPSVTGWPRNCAPS